MPSHQTRTDMPPNKQNNQNIETLHQRLEIFEVFITRRFDEISMEINATAQQAAMAETYVDQKLLDILTLLETNTDNNASPVAKIDTLGAIENIMACIHNDHDWDDQTKRNDMRKRIEHETQAILAAYQT